MNTRLATLAFPVLASWLGCGGTGDPGPVEPTRVTFPAGMLWGSATAGFQIEKGLGDTDWGLWAATPDAVANGDRPDDGPDALAHIADDVARMKEAGLGAYRFSLEMARVFPTRAAFDAGTPDAAGLASYDTLVDTLVASGITPMVTLHHFVWPSYMSDPSDRKNPQGWERDDAIPVFTEWCSRMAERYGDRVDLWVTINEPNVEATVGYLAGVFPPGVLDIERTATVLRTQVRAHARCYDAVHARDGADADGDGVTAAVGIANHQRVYEPTDPTSEDDLAAAEHARYAWNLWIMEAIVRGRVDDDFDGIPEKEDPMLAGRADFYGLNYYGVSRIAAAGLRFKYLGAIPTQNDLPTSRPKSDLGWDIHPAGFATVLDEAIGYGLPIHITENGIADALDVNRSRFTAEHLFELGRARSRGADVRGYFHWSLVDNFEWAAGFCPRFGLYRVDLDDPARSRTATAAVELLRGVATSHTLDREAIDALPPYQSKPHPCAGF